MRVHALCCIRIAGLVLLASALRPSLAQTPAWFRQFGTHDDDAQRGMAPDGLGGAFFCGSTTGELGGFVNPGGSDIWIARYDALGLQVFLKQFGTPFNDLAEAMASDGSGGVFAAGYSMGSLGGPNFGGSDVWLARFDAAGNQLWSKQLGTENWEQALGAAEDGQGGVFLTGMGSTGGTSFFVARFDSAGNTLWIRQLGSTIPQFDKVHAATPDGSGGVYVTGETLGDMGGQAFGTLDGWLARLAANGDLMWIRHVGTSESDRAYGLAPRALGGVYVTGETYGSLGGTSAGNWDLWLASFDGAGNLVWAEQFGSSGWDNGGTIAADGSGGVYLTGTDGAQNKSWLRHIDSAGQLLHFVDFAAEHQVYASFKSAAATLESGLLLGGETYGAVGGSHVGYTDPFLMRWVQPSAAGANYCTALTSTNGCLPSMVAVGTPSVSAADSFSVFGTALEPGKNGLLLFGTTGQANLPFLGGTLCVAAPLYRLPVQFSASAALCSGSLGYTLNDYLAHPSGGALLVPGTVVDSQIWYRDPPAAFAAGLSSGLEFTVLP